MFPDPSSQSDTPPPHEKQAKIYSPGIFFVCLFIPIALCSILNLPFFFYFSSHPCLSHFPTSPCDYSVFLLFFSSEIQCTHSVVRYPTAVGWGEYGLEWKLICLFQIKNEKE
jgi:hypothetical protein